MAAELVDWDLATATARRLASPGPSLPLADARAVVAELRVLADEAEAHVAGYTALRPAPEARTSVTVVDRPEWARSNVASMRLLLGPLMQRLERSQTPTVVTAVGRRMVGVELGGALAYLSSRVLGQYEVFLPIEEGDGRLSLVAPNLVETERRLGVDPRDFRMWVCLHEQTHRTQFTAVPWMRGHLEGLIGQFMEATDLDAAALLARVGDIARSLRQGRRLSPLELLQSPAQQVVTEQLQAVMTLLEGHAEQVMDAVGPAVVPSVATIRERFDARRGGGSPLDRLVRRLLGLDAKLEQYRTGGAFVRTVVGQVGVSGFNQVWESPAALPTVAELKDPPRWLERVSRPREVPTAP